MAESSAARSAGPAEDFQLSFGQAVGVEQRFWLCLESYLVEKRLDRPVHVLVHGATDYVTKGTRRN